MGRLAGYGLGLMFIAGYALLYSNLTLMVVLGAMLLTMDRHRRDATDSAPATNAPMISTPGFIGGRTYLTDLCTTGNRMNEPTARRLISGRAISGNADAPSGFGRLPGPFLL